MDQKAAVGVDVLVADMVPSTFGMVTFNPKTGKLEELDEDPENGIRRLAPHEALTAAGATITCLYPGGELRKLCGDDYNLPEVDSDNIAFDLLSIVIEFFAAVLFEVGMGMLEAVGDQGKRSSLQQKACFSFAAATWPVQSRQPFKFKKGVGWRNKPRQSLDAKSGNPFVIGSRRSPPPPSAKAKGP